MNGGINLASFKLVFMLILEWPTFIIYMRLNIFLIVLSVKIQKVSINIKNCLLTSTKIKQDREETSRNNLLTFFTKIIN